MSDLFDGIVAPIKLPTTIASCRRETTVVVEPDDHGAFWIHRQRGDASMSQQSWTREELILLQSRIGAALEGALPGTVTT